MTNYIFWRIWPFFFCSDSVYCALLSLQANKTGKVEIFLVISRRTKWRKTDKRRKKHVLLSYSLNHTIYKWVMVWVRVLSCGGVFFLLFISRPKIRQHQFLTEIIGSSLGYRSVGSCLHISDMFAVLCRFVLFSNMSELLACTSALSFHTNPVISVVF